MWYIEMKKEDFREQNTFSFISLDALLQLIHTWSYKEWAVRTRTCGCIVRMVLWFPKALKSTSSRFQFAMWDLYFYWKICRDIEFPVQPFLFEHKKNGQEQAYLFMRFLTTSWSRADSWSCPSSALRETSSRFIRLFLYHRLKSWIKQPKNQPIELKCLSYLDLLSK